VPIAERFGMDAGAVLDNVSKLEPDLFLVIPIHPEVVHGERSVHYV
jgi:hypothetical protein